MYEMFSVSSFFSDWNAIPTHSPACWVGGIGGQSDDAGMPALLARPTSGVCNAQHYRICLPALQGHHAVQTAGNMPGACRGCPDYQTQAPGRHTPRSLKAGPPLLPLLMAASTCKDGSIRQSLQVSQLEGMHHAAVAAVDSCCCLQAGGCMQSRGRISAGMAPPPDAAHCPAAACAPPAPPPAAGLDTQSPRLKCPAALPELLCLSAHASACASTSAPSQKKNWRTWMPSSSAAPCAYPVTSMRLTTPLVTLMVSPPMG